MKDSKEQKPDAPSGIATIPPYMKAVSGSLGGIMEACCLQPIDVIKTRLQLDTTGNYKGIVHCGSTIVRTEGVRALWKGLTPFAMHLTLKYALRMGSNAVLQAAFKDSETGKLSNHGRVLAGFGAGVLEALVIVTPFEVSISHFHLKFHVRNFKFDELLVVIAAIWTCWNKMPIELGFCEVAD
uniref:Tricarboxylate transport protein n=1 Tax=Rhizophora mucronata TaxID=61149 RepID=A0A2P2IS95_RHIMU